jgi:flagellar biosynthesis protein FlhF
MKDRIEITGAPEVRPVDVDAKGEAAVRPPETAATQTEPRERLSVRRTGVPLRSEVKPALDEDIACVKRMLAQVLQTTRRQSMSQLGGGDECAQIGRLSDPLSDHYLMLLEGAVAAEIAEDLIGAVRDELTPGELGDESIVRQAMLRHLARMIPACREAPKAGRQEDGRAKTIALIGPTGVGKTTTVAKLAASYKLRHGKRVGLVTTDTYRIAAVDQLRMYANIIGVPLKVAMTPEEMSAAVQSMSDMDAILIDTAGRSQRDAERLQELTRFIDAARPHETHLVLASTSHESVLVDAARQFAKLSPNRMIFTKLDEAVNFGILLNVARRVELELSYVTTGQEVPDHIEVGSPDRLARLVLEGGRRAEAVAG